MNIRIEHANICVDDIDAMMAFLQTVCPDFGVRGEGGSQKDRWVHYGTNDTYIALQQSTSERDPKWSPYCGAPGTNHLAYVVDDVDSLRDRLSSAGYKDTTVPNKHPHRKRIYFNDPEGNDWEFVQYLSQDMSERHDYELPDK